MTTITLPVTINIALNIDHLSLEECIALNEATSISIKQRSWLPNLRNYSGWDPRARTFIGNLTDPALLAIIRPAARIVDAANLIFKHLNPENPPQLRKQGQANGPAASDEGKRI